MPGTPQQARGAGIVGLALYYAFLVAAAAALFALSPETVGLFADVGRVLTPRPEVGALAFPAPAPPPAVPRPLFGMLLAAGSMLGALALMLPVTRVYMLTRRRRGYDESVVHTLLILPVAVTGIVILVQNSIALAFSLAGIVAAVRFRTTLEDTKDAVYVFLAIGVGIAAGVQALGVALVLSAFFNAVILVLWRTGFGNVYADSFRGGGSLPLAEALAGAGAPVLRVGDPALLDAAGPADLASAAKHAARLERHISYERTKSRRKRANTLILAYTTDLPAAERQLSAALEDLADSWRFAEIVPGPEETVILVYLARLDGDPVRAAVADRIRPAEGSAIRAVEVVSLQGLKPRS